MKNDVDVDLGLNISSLKIIKNPINGTATLNNDSTISYIGNTNFFGKDSLIYEICGINNTCDTAYFVINVTNTTDDVIANRDVTTTAEETEVKFNVVANDTDVDLGFDLSKLTSKTIFKFENC